MLRRRLERLVEVYRDDYGVDVSRARRRAQRVGWPAGLACVGAETGHGFDVVADHVDLDAQVEGADLVVTDEGSSTRSPSTARWSAASTWPTIWASGVVAVVGEAYDGAEVQKGRPCRSPPASAERWALAGHAALLSQVAPGWWAMPAMTFQGVVADRVVHLERTVRPVAGLDGEESRRSSHVVDTDQVPVLQVDAARRRGSPPAFWATGR